LPPVPFNLNRWTKVVDAGKMLKHLQADIRLGPNGPRARYGAIQHDVVELKRFILDANELNLEVKGTECEYEQN
jgi:hypothetical protein